MEFFILKDLLFGFDGWGKNHTSNGIPNYYSKTSTLNHSLRLNDSISGFSTFLIHNSNTNLDSHLVYVKKDLKRPNNSYQPDSRQNRPEVSVFGDDKRFFLIIGYKQNPKSHHLIITFGDFQDSESENWKTVLFGYINSGIGNVGFNRAFTYSQWKVLPTRIYFLPPRYNY